jgi:hypothetical protein
MPVVRGRILGYVGALAHTYPKIWEPTTGIPGELNPDLLREIRWKCTAEIRLTIFKVHSKLPPVRSLRIDGEVAQRWSSGLISHWLWVRIPPSPLNKNRPNNHVRAVFCFIRSYLSPRWRVKPAPELLWSSAGDP